MAKNTGGWNKVYDLVKRIPRGRVVTYGQLAQMLHLPGGARTAGYAIAGCPSGQGIPWHRVVGAGGKLLPREPYGSKQRRLLESEGTHFAGMSVDMAAHQWRPTQSAKGRPKPRPKNSQKQKHPKPGSRKRRPV
ncbi:MAG TPA: MGMT family protein [Candidatus Acidoferrales bacterium]|nr:MGMT family protein [Candidatus Acidoferrales bacterium]